VLGLECSRLARNSADWHQLLELCGMTGTLICDEDGLYDPAPSTTGCFWGYLTPPDRRL
jgi:DNA invertase Pin-like site-specific DNA recombinase